MKYIDRDIRESVLEKIRPTQAEIEEQQRVINTLRDALVERAIKIEQEYTFIEAQGSTGPKQTQLRGAADVDLFIGLDPTPYMHIIKKRGAERNRNLSKIFDEIVDVWFIPAAKTTRAMNILKAYSQHPYLSLTMGSLDVDVIACFDLTPEELSANGPITAVDRTAHHTRFVAKSINNRLRDDVRVLKSFVRASHAYGDTCAVGQMGFTGYALEIITILGGGLNPAIDLLLKLQRDPIDPLNRPESVLRNIPGIKDDYIIVIDPTDIHRNVASSFAPRAVKWVLKRLRHLISIDTSMDCDTIINMLLEQPIPAEKLPRWISPHATSCTFRSSGTAHYTLYRDKLYRITRQIASQIKKEKTGETRFGEVLWEIYFEDDVFAIGFIVELPQIGDTYRRRGPPIRLEDAVVKFKSKHPDAYREGDYLWTTIKRQWTDAKEQIEYLVKDIVSEGFERVNEDVISARVLNTLYRFVMRVEDKFPLSKRQEYKEALRSLPW